MARIALTCECGWNFFLPGSTPGCEIACPSCTRLVSIPGRKPGMDVPLSPGAIAARIQRRAALVRSAMLVLGLAVAAGAAALAWRNTPGPTAEPGPAPGAKGEARPRLLPPTPETPPPRPASIASARIQQLRRRVLENV